MNPDDIPREALNHLQTPDGLNFAQEAREGSNAPIHVPTRKNAPDMPPKGFKEGFCRLASRLRGFFGLSAVLMLVFAPGCASRRSGDWYNGPAEWKEPARAAINTALAELPPEVKRPLKWDWSRNRLTLKVVEPVGFDRGEPYIISPNGERAFGYALPQSITVPAGFKPRTLIHESGHVVLWANGISGDHHKFPYFKRH